MGSGGHLVERNGLSSGIPFTDKERLGYFGKLAAPFPFVAGEPLGFSTSLIDRCGGHMSTVSPVDYLSASPSFH